MSTTRGSGASRGGEDFHNEDAFLVSDGMGLYIVCDGLGSRPAGEVAAEVAVGAVDSYLQGRLGGGAAGRAAAPLAIIEGAVRHALDAVLAAGEAHPELEGMATTVTLLLAQGDRGIFGHSGDSRAYLIRRGRCVLLTSDHEWTEAVTAPPPREPVESSPLEGLPVETFGLPLHPGDTIVLCTDGAESTLEDPGLIRGAGDDTPRLLASRIVSLAHRKDSGSDATAVVIRVRDSRDHGWLELSRPPRDVAFGHAMTYA